MDEEDRESAERVRSLLERGQQDPSTFRAALLSVPPTQRDAWLDLVFGLGELPEDGPELPRDCVPYLPCSVDVLLRMVEQTPVRASDVFVDIGSGLGRAAALVHLLTGAAAIGLEIQPRLVHAARDLAARLFVSRTSCVEGDATKLAGLITIGSVFFLYCPFSGDRLTKVLAELELIARTRTIRVCCVDLPLPPCSWLTLQPQLSGDLAIYRSTLHDQASSRHPSALSSIGPTQG
jgi:SAM-dependent methyltransferase